jgi:hypothetical protein
MTKMLVPLRMPAPPPRLFPRRTISDGAPARIVVPRYWCQVATTGSSAGRGGAAGIDGGAS